MLRKVHLHQHSLLIALVVFSVASTPIAWTACTYVNGGHRCLQQRVVANDQDVDETVESEQSHCSKKQQHASKHFAQIDSQQTITPVRDQCSHCMTHSRSEANAPSRVAIINSSSDHGIAAEPVVSIFTSQISNRPLVDVHEHGPPGSQDRRYILNSSFRI